jgi:hypothetical protein
LKDKEYFQKILETNNATAIKKMLSKKNSLVFDHSFIHNTFVYVTSYNQVEIIKILLNDSRFDPSISNNISLIQCITYNSIESLKLLLKDKRIKFTSTNSGIIGHAVLNLNHEALKILLKNKEVNPNTWKLFFTENCCEISAYKTLSALLSHNKFNPISQNNAFITEAFNNKKQTIVDLLWSNKKVKDTLENDNNTLFNYLSQIDLKNKIGSF